MKSIIYLFFLENNELGPLKHVNAFLKYFDGRIDVVTNVSKDNIKNYASYYKVNKNKSLSLFRNQISTIKIISRLYNFNQIRYNYVVVRHSVGLVLPHIYLKLKGVKVVLEVNGLLYQDLKDRHKSKIIQVGNFIFEFLVYHLVDNIVLVHENLKLRLMKRYKLKSKKFTVVENGIEAKEYESLKISKKKKGFDLNKVMIGYLGSLAHREGVDILLSHFKKLTVPNVYLCIIGGSIDEFKGLVRMSQIDLRTQDKIIYHPYLPYVEALDYISACDINIHLRRPLKGVQDSQGSPLKMLDYLNVSRPVIASRISSYSFIEEYDFGILINPYSFEEFNLAVRKILKSYENYDNNKGNCFVKENSSWTKKLKAFNKF